MSILFSIIIYAIVVSQQSRPVHPPDRINQEQMMSDTEDIQAIIDQRDANTRSSVILSLVVLNVGVLAAGGVFSRYLARRTMRPIEQAMNSQTQFVSDASHELRTPLTVLLTTNEVALRKKNIDDAKAREILVKNVNEIEKLKELSNSLLALADSEQSHASQPILKETWVDALVCEVVGSLQPHTEAKNIIILKSNLLKKE